MGSLSDRPPVGCGPTYVYEFPTGSGNMLNLQQIARELTKRLLKIFERDGAGKFQYHANHHPHLAIDAHFKDHHLFFEFFHGDTGRGLGASHQTGWTALIANLLLEMEEEDVPNRSSHPMSYDLKEHLINKN